MFSNLLFLVFVLLLISIPASSDGWIALPTAALAVSLLAYAALCLWIWGRNRLSPKKSLKHKEKLLIWTNVEILIFFVVYQFIFVGQRVFAALPLLPMTAASIFALALYFGALAIFHASIYRNIYVFQEAGIQTRYQYLADQFLMWVPFTLPFLLFTVIFDLIDSTAIGAYLDDDSQYGSLIVLSLTGLFMLGMLTFLPYLVRRMWLCTPIDDHRLNSICSAMRFKHAGMYEWTVMNHTITAAIIGIIPKIRYVIFTKRLLDQLPKESIEAVLVHEIGHSKLKHLLLLPFIIFGMVLCGSLYSVFLGEQLLAWIDSEITFGKGVAEPLAIYLPLVLIFGLYFRYVFGFYSRLFERQADLYIFTTSLPPEVMHDALDNIGIATGHTHDKPSWHHYSIRQRMQFLELAIANPALVKTHQKRVIFWLICYAFFFVTASITLYLQWQ